MLQSFLVSLAMAILKYYATIAGKEITAYIKEQEALRENKKKADEFQKVVIKNPSTREERRNAENSALE